MSNYNTGNPVPSIDPRDLDDNATNFDLLLLSAVPSVADRLGVLRKTWWQMEQDASALVSPNITALAALVGAANKGFYFTGPAAMSTFDLSAQGRTFLAATTQAAQRTALQLVKTTSATDTTAGSLLQTGDGGILGLAPAITDCDALSAGGLYRIANTATGGPGFTGLLLHMQYGTAGQASCQIFLRTTSANAPLLYRTKATSTAYTAWQATAGAGANTDITSLTGVTLAGSTTLTGPLNNAPAQTLASAATVNLAASTADSINVTGTTTITGLGNAAVGVRRRLIFAGALTLTNNAAITIPGGASITTAAGDVVDVESTGASAWRVTNLQRASGKPAAFAYDRSNILAAVAQSAGVPTGGIIETGGTLTGTGVYTKYADGTMIIVKTLAIATGCVTAAGSIFRSAATAAGAFPVNFINAPTISLMGSDSGGGGWPAMDVFGNASTWGSYSTRNHVSSGTTCVVHLTAIGRWF